MIYNRCDYAEPVATADIGGLPLSEHATASSNWDVGSTLCITFSLSSFTSTMWQKNC